MRKTRGQIGQRVMRGVVRIGHRHGPSNPLAALPMPLRLHQGSAVASRIAGARGRSALGLDYVERLGVYQEQNGPPYKLTPRQRRRLKHKAGHQESQARGAILRRAELAKHGVADARYVDDPWRGGAGDGQ